MRGVLKVIAKNQIPYQDEEWIFENDNIYIMWHNIHLQQKCDGNENDLPRFESEESISS